MPGGPDNSPVFPAAKPPRRDLSADSTWAAVLSRAGFLLDNTEGAAQRRGHPASSPSFTHLLCGCFEAKSPPSDSAIF